MEIERHIFFRAESKDYVAFVENDVSHMLMGDALAHKCRTSNSTVSGMA